MLEDAIFLNYFGICRNRNGGVSTQSLGLWKHVILLKDSDSISDSMR